MIGQHTQLIFHNCVNKNKRQRESNVNWRMDNPEAQATLRTRHRTKTIKKKTKKLRNTDPTIKCSRGVSSSRFVRDILRYTQHIVKSSKSLIRDIRRKQISNLLGNNLHNIILKIKRLESQIVLFFVSTKTKGPKQDHQNEGEKYVIFFCCYIHFRLTHQACDFLQRSFKS